MHIGNVAITSSFQGISLVVQWLGLRAFTAEGVGSIPGQELRSCKPDFPGGTVVKNPPASAGDTGSSPGPGRSHMPQSN